MDEISTTTTAIILTIIGSVFSFLAWGIKQFMTKTEQTLEKHDDRLDRLENDLGTTIALAKNNQENMAKMLQEMSAKIDRIDSRLERYDREVLDYIKSK